MWPQGAWLRSGICCSGSGERGPEQLSIDSYRYREERHEDT